MDLLGDIGEPTKIGNSMEEEVKLPLRPIVKNQNTGNELQKKKFIHANLPLEKQKNHLLPPTKDPVKKILLDDALWKEAKFKSEEKKKKHKRDMPWNETEEKPAEAGISERLAFAQRQMNRTWYPVIGDQKLEDSYVWHGVINVKDHLGRSWVCAPINRTLANKASECCVPKAAVHKYSYHTSSVTDVQFIPVYGHMFLSSSSDTTVRIWSVLGDRQCVQTYMGHINAVNSISFNRDGFKFASCCLGKRLKLWDTEKGKKIYSTVVDSIPSQCQMLAKDDKNEEIIIAMTDGRIAHYDFRIGGTEGQKPICDYSAHKSDALAVTLVADKYFMSSSKDRSLCLWEFGMRKPIAMVREEWMTPATALATHPDGVSVAAQLAGKEIAVFDTRNGIKVDPQRAFIGSDTESFPCRMSFSPDGRFLTQGDRYGALHIWNWKSAAQVRSEFRIHNDVISKAQWSPYDASQIIVSSYDNNMTLLD